MRRREFPGGSSRARVEEGSTSSCFLEGSRAVSPRSLPRMGGRSTCGFDLVVNHRDSKIDIIKVL